MTGSLAQLKLDGASQDESLSIAIDWIWLIWSWNIAETPARRPFFFFPFRKSSIRQKPSITCKQRLGALFWRGRKGQPSS